MDRTSMLLMTGFRDRYLSQIQGASILDVGSRGVRNYRRLFEPAFKYVGMDIIPGPNVDIIGFEDIDIAFDVVISGQVMEHVKRPWEWLKLLTSYFTKYICIIAPHTWKEHKYPLDTYRYLTDGMRDLFEYAGIKELEIKMDRRLTVGIGEK